MFIPLAIGVIASAACSPAVNKHYLSVCSKYGDKPPPELRLIPMMCSCWLIPIGLFIFAWTSYPELSWWGPAIGGLPVGFGFIFLYNSANNYLVDSYQHQAASALAAKTCIRSFWGAATGMWISLFDQFSITLSSLLTVSPLLVLFTAQMYDRLGYQWATSLLAFIALACCAIPFVFYYWGARIRQRSKYAFAEPEKGDEEKNAGAQ